MKLFDKAASLNKQGLDLFAQGDPEQASNLLRKAYLILPNEPGILVNLGLSLMQSGMPNLAEKAYKLVINQKQGPKSTKRSACKNLGFLKLWQGEFEEGWYWHTQRFEGESFLKNQWKGDPLDGQQLTIWNDVGMGDAFQFVRYTKPLIEQGEKIRLAVDKSQIELFRNHLSWPIHKVVDRRKIDKGSGPHIPLMSLIPLLDPFTSWGRSFQSPTFQIQELATSSEKESAIGICWASNPKDQTMHIYKSLKPEKLINCIRRNQENTKSKIISLQTDEEIAHQRLGLKPTIREWQKTLRKINECKEVWCVDTAVAHLAAGMGKPVRMMLNNPPDWRWRCFQERNAELKMVWYPSLSIKQISQIG